MSEDHESASTKLFRKFDADKDRHLDIGEVATLFKRLSPEQSTESAYNAAVEALLLSDNNVDKRLSHKEFEQLLTKLADMSSMTMEEAAERLLQTSQQKQQQHQHHEQVTSTAADGEAAEQAHTASPTSEEQQQQQQQQQQYPGAASVAAAGVNDQVKQQGPAVVPPSSTAVQLMKDDRMLQLFRLWDRGGDGSVCFEELCHGLAKFRPITGKQDVLSTLNEAASVLALHDSDGDQRLDLQDFSRFMDRFIAAAGYQLSDVFDQLIITASKPPSRKLQKVLTANQADIQVLLQGEQ